MTTFMIRFGIEANAEQDDRREIGSAGRTTRPRFDLGSIVREEQRPVVSKASGKRLNEDDYPEIDLG